MNTPLTDAYFSSGPQPIINSPASSQVGLYQYGGAVLGGLSAVAGIFGGKAQQQTMKMQENLANFNAELAKSQALANTMMLKKDFNTIEANRAVMTVAQGRSFSSGTVQNLMRVDRENLAWDIDMIDKESQKQYHAAKAGAAGYAGAARVSDAAGVTKGLMSFADTAYKYGSIK